ncbi:putative F-box protein At3g10430 [Papaver somniferum]|uniref:putative F-box protein At3g10430 n=1 Tax=Papaver somniferum TaxID=3469 RepID=UPI000E6F4AEF|nr:putative F-box protein At3g10430 [Papaver somniferum]XP_026423458.1 putative F-box protein At3g10430 [Papaver somniferum]
MRNLMNLPTEIQLDIITRLPTETILDCKLVCKSWRILVSHRPSFYQMYSSHLNNSIDSGKSGYLVFSENRKQVYYLQYNDNHHDQTPNHSITRFDLTPPFTSYHYKVLGSFNGLVCLYGYQNYCICNPMTRESVMLPKFKNDDQYIHYSSGFGYLPLTNEYKVVEFYKLGREPNFVEAAVYTLGSGEGWRNVGRFDGTGEVCVEDNVSVNGALHWVDYVGGWIYIFDLTEEKFREHVSPPPLPPDFMWYNFSIGVYGVDLYYAIRYFCRNTECSWTDIWLQNKKNDDEPLGWSKEFHLLESEPLAFTKSGSVLCFSDGSLVIHDAIDSTSEQLMDFTALRQIFPHNNTLVSLRELGEVDIQVMKSAEDEETKTPDLPTKHG